MENRYRLISIHTHRVVLTEKVSKGKKMLLSKQLLFELETVYSEIEKCVIKTRILILCCERVATP